MFSIAVHSCIDFIMRYLHCHCLIFLINRFTVRGNRSDSTVHLCCYLVGPKLRHLELLCLSFHSTASSIYLQSIPTCRTSLFSCSFSLAHCLPATSYTDGYYDTAEVPVGAPPIGRQLCHQVACSYFEQELSVK